MTKYASRDELRAGIRKEHSAAFDTHLAIAAALQSCVLHSRHVATPLETAIDFLFIQAYKAHDAVGVLAENGLAEDAATVTRRLLEIGVQAIYIGADSEPTECERRAGRYLAFMWRQMTPEAKAHLPADAVAHWGAMASKYGADIPPKAIRWGPTFKDMFTYAEREDTYRSDYALLSQIAHGSPEEFILHYSAERFRLRSTLHLPAILVYSSRYYVGITDVWNRHFKVLSPKQIAALVERLNDDDSPPAT